MNAAQSVTMSLAGPLSNRLIAMGINSYLDNNEREMNENARSFLGTAYVWNRGNFAWYIFRSYIDMLLPGDSVSDWGNAANAMVNGNIPLTYLVMSGVVILEIWDLWASKDEIAKNYDRMLGRYPDIVTTAGAIGFKIMPYGKGFLISRQLAF
jgi:hypothetical protein